jgi:5-methyltetrahydrofolate--homocysteine methyltransferase
MTYNLQELEKEQITTPILIGGAATSKAHTALKLAPQYNGIVCHVSDASLVTGVCSKMLAKEKRKNFHDELKLNQKNIRARFQNKNQESLFVPFKKSQEQKFRPIWTKAKIAYPKFYGTKIYHNITVTDLVEYIDWSPFFWTWSLKGFYPKIFSSSKYGEQAKQLFADAQQRLKKIIAQDIFKPKGVLGFWAANSLGDDIELYESMTERKKIETLCFLRQQRKKNYTRSLSISIRLCSTKRVKG